MTGDARSALGEPLNDFPVRMGIRATDRWTIWVTREAIEDDWVSENPGEPLTDVAARKWMTKHTLVICFLAERLVASGYAAPPEITITSEDWRDRLGL